jgi:predicted dithiol-disulfide oxidoreductase (DUF899 family)
MRSANIVSRDEWLKAHEALLAKEKALTRAHDALAAERRRQPWERVARDYVFDAPGGKLSLADLFDARTQLIVYHHMLKPADADPCPGCCMVADHIGHLAHLHARDTPLVFASRAPIAEIEAFRKRMGWTMPWFSTLDRFNADFDVASGFGLNVFLRRGEEIFRTYFTSGRGVEGLGSIWTFLDLTPLGRQEDWEDSPEGAPRTAPYRWWRLHDEYDDAPRADRSLAGRSAL